MLTVNGTASASPEHSFGGYYMDIDISRERAARYGLTTGDVQDVISTALGGMQTTTTVEGLERYPVNIRYARDLRDDAQSIRQVLVPTSTGAQIPLGQLADVKINPGPPMIKSENSRRSAWMRPATVQDAVFDGLTIEQILAHDVRRNPKSRHARAASVA